ncbi:hypothetical protein Acr_01g0001240 [Actinidia rufa]|uniref:Leucine-rich repeat-containing N-terminal plant-type domain-containing protein n=1 Tax=Actinidia rufa TaxID=165716 RepID=A0A7J0E1D0_9ERIC|nr:hypothetical protein Acr_01g0001240 [Actinidia rufa]
MATRIHKNPLSLLLLLLLAFSFSHLQSQACHEQDREALLGFKRAITSDPSRLLRSWTSSSDCCSAWEGVACDTASGGRVVNVSRSGLVSGNDFILDTYMSWKFIAHAFQSHIPQDPRPHCTSAITAYPVLYLPLFFHHSLRFLNWVFSGNNLSGSIPSSIGKMVSLTKLDLHENNFSGTIPESIGKLKVLEYLDLSENQIFGNIPKSIGGLSKLVLLYLNSNRLTGSVPSSVSGLSSLQFFRLSENKLTGTLPPSIGLLPKIQRLIFENNLFTGKLPATIGHLTTLTDIFFSNNRFSGKIPPSFGLKGNLPSWLSSSSISTLDLSSNGLKGKLPTWIANMTNLSFLNLSNNGFFSSVPEEFKNLSLLMDLDLHSNKLSGHLDTIFSKNVHEPLGHFNSIDLSNNMFTGSIDADVGEKPVMASIVSLVLSHNPLGGSIPKSLGKLSGLEVLKLRGNGLSGTIPMELGNAKELEIIVLSDNNLSGEIPEKLLNLEGLREFDVSGNRLSGKIPPHKAIIPVSGFMGNPGLCGSPLPPCKHS